MDTPPLLICPSSRFSRTALEFQITNILQFLTHVDTFYWLTAYTFLLRCFDNFHKSHKCHQICENMRRFCATKSIGRSKTGHPVLKIHPSKKHKYRTKRTLALTWGFLLDYARIHAVVATSLLWSMLVRKYIFLGPEVSAVWLCAIASTPNRDGSRLKSYRNLYFVLEVVFLFLFPLVSVCPP